MTSPREHIEEIRRKKFSIGGEENPLSEDLHQAVKNLSAELYAKDLHFLMELIQNAEDNEYSESVDPSLEFVITSNDITATGAPATLIIFNNEVGFSRKNIDSICSVGRSTKKENRKKGYIGEKGIGFKSVFLITSTPYIFSNGYQIRFNEDPCDHCGLGYVVPEWVEQNPTASQIKQLYGSSTVPTTTLVLPLKADKVKAVTSQLSSIHPQVLLFLSKIKRLSVRSGLSSVTEVAIVKETDYAQRKNINAESFTIHLAAAGPESACSFYMWRQRFPVPAESRVERRRGVDEWTVVLAFPLGDSASVKKSPGIYAFLPTEMVTGFPFVIQADFVLSSSRETILLDCPWNRGILGRVPHAFSAAFKSLVTANPDVPLSTLPGIFQHLPVEPSSYPELNTAVRDGIRARLSEEHVVPSEPTADQRLFHRPREVGRLLPGFWTVLARARRDGVSLSSLSSHGKFVLAGAFDRKENDRFLAFLGVEAVGSEWYGKCILGSQIVSGISEAGYVELISFVAAHWGELGATNLCNIPLLKYEGLSGMVLLRSVAGSTTILQCSQPGEVEWLIEWNHELGCPGSLFFIPRAIQEAIRLSANRAVVLQWLKSHAKTSTVDVYEYAALLCGSVRERRLVVSYTHFLHHSMKKGFLTEARADYLCSQMPVVDNYGNVVTSRSGVLVPAKGSKWASLVGSNAWRGMGYVELSEDYLSPAKLSREKDISGFLRDRAKAEDVPSIPIPNSGIATAGSPLTKNNAFLLLDWIRNRRGTRLPSQFVENVSNGSWLRITVKGCSGFRPPCESFMLSSSSRSWASLLQSGSVLVDIPLVDRSYYGNAIDDYAAELRAVGVKSEYSEACEFIGGRLMSLSRYGNLTKENVLSILGFIAFLRKQCLSPKEFIESVKDGEWMKTSLGDKSPQESVLYNDTWRVALEISDIPFVDVDYYGRGDICRYQEELELLGVAFSFTASHYQFMVDRLKPSQNLARLSNQGLLTLLLCISLDKSSEKIVRALAGTPCLKTSSGYRSPVGSVLCDQNWACLLQIFNTIPLVDSTYYGSQIFKLKSQLKRIGVVIDFEEAVKEFVRYFKESASSRTVSKENVMSLLAAYKKVDTSLSVPSDLNKCLREQKWLRTRHCDYLRSPKECILYSSDWEAISPIATLPFIDDTENWYGKGVYAYKKELKSMGAVVDFKAGVKFVASGLHNFHEVESVSSATALSLLGCVKILSAEKDYKFPEDFTIKLSQPWMKTYLGYRAPQECLLYDPNFADSGLKKSDGPFIDEEFYGSKLADYRGVLASIGVTVEVEKGSPLIAAQLKSQTQLSKILRLYHYLARYNWEPKSESDMKIWIPTGSHTGNWVSPGVCVVHDKSGLFSSQLTVLDEHYKTNLFFFSSTFKVKLIPDTEDYCRLWRTWEESDRSLSQEECCKFWSYITKHCS